MYSSLIYDLPLLFPVLPRTSPLAQIRSSSISLQKSSGLPGISMKHGIWSYNTSHIKTGKCKPVEGKRFQKQAEESETAPTPTVRSSVRRLTIASIYAEDLVQTHSGYLIGGSGSVRDYELRLVGSVDFCVVSLTGQTPTILHLFHGIPQALPNVW